MTYPQRPPEPYGQRPIAPFGPPPGSYGQQPGGYGQWPASPGYGQPPAGYGGFPPPYPPPRKTNTGLIIGIIVAAIVVLGGGGVGAYVLFSQHGGSGPSTTASADPNATAQGFARTFVSFAHTLSTDDLARLKNFLCVEDQRALQSLYDHRNTVHTDTDPSLTMSVDHVSINGTKGTFEATVSDATNPPVRRTWQLVSTDSRWLVCGVFNQSSLEPNGTGG